MSTSKYFNLSDNLSPLTKQNTGTKCFYKGDSTPSAEKDHEMWLKDSQRISKLNCVENYFDTIYCDD